MQKCKCELKRKTRDGDRKRDFKVRGKIIIPSGGGATGHSVQRWCQQPIYSPPGLTACPHKLISHHLTRLCSIFFLESGVSQKLSVLKHPVSASSQTPPVMMWALLPGVSQSNPISSTSKPHPCEELCLEKPVLLWGTLIWGDALIKLTHCILAESRRPQERCLVSHLQLHRTQFPSLTRTLFRAQTLGLDWMADESHTAH